MGNLITPLEVTGSTPQERVLAAIGTLRQLPASVPVVHKALALMENSDFDVGELKKTMLQDQAVAARLLRLANSAYFGFRSEVQTVSQAIVLLGQDRIRTLLRRILADKLLLELTCGLSAAGPLRRMSLATATASCTLSQLLMREEAEEMLLAGLLHNIGELFFLSQFPAEYEQARRLAQGQNHREAEEAVLGIRAGLAGRLLLENWSFPPLYVAVVEHWEHPLSPECPPELATPAALVHVAAKLAEAEVTGVPAAAALDTIAPEILETFYLDVELLDEVYASLPARMSMEQLQAGR